MRHRTGYVRVQPKAPRLEVRICSNCLWPIPLGRSAGGLCNACATYKRRKGVDRPVDRLRELEVVAQLARDYLFGNSGDKELIRALVDLDSATQEYLRRACRIDRVHLLELE